MKNMYYLFLAVAIFGGSICSAKPSTKEPMDRLPSSVADEIPLFIRTTDMGCFIFENKVARCQNFAEGDLSRY